MGIVLVFFSSRAILTPTSLWQFCLSMACFIKGRLKTPMLYELEKLLIKVKKAGIYNVKSSFSRSSCRILVILGTAPIYSSSPKKIRRRTVNKPTQKLLTLALMLLSADTMANPNSVLSPRNHCPTS